MGQTLASVLQPESVRINIALGVHVAPGAKTSTSHRFRQTHGWSRTALRQAQGRRRSANAVTACLSWAFLNLWEMAPGTQDINVSWGARRRSPFAADPRRFGTERRWGDVGIRAPA